MESFVDSQIFRGTAYKASHWTLLGKTDGFKRVAQDFYVHHGRPKQLWVKSLEPDGPALLSSAVLPEPWGQYEKVLPVQCGIATAHLPSLLERFGDLVDSRKGQGKRHRLRQTLRQAGRTPSHLQLRSNPHQAATARLALLDQSPHRRV